MSHKKFPIHPANPERLCWGCDKYCATTDMMCGNGSDRTQHPYELFGQDWQSWGNDFKVDEQERKHDTADLMHRPRLVSMQPQFESSRRSHDGAICTESAVADVPSRAVGANLPPTIEVFQS